MSIQSEIERLQQAKANLKTAINGKGGNITDDKLDSYYMYVNEINTGSDVSGVTATPGDVRKTVKYVTASGELVSGTMPDSTASVADGKVTVTAGYLSADYVYTIPAVEGTDLSFITAGSGQILYGYVGADKDGNPINGTITTKTSDDVTFVGGTVEMPPGYYAGVSKSIPVGKTTQSGNTVNISEGWHYDQSVDVGAAYPGGTIKPGTEDQIIEADSYITSTLTIKGDANWKEENIAKGVTMWGKTGTYSGTDTSDATAIAGFVIDGYTFYGADGKETGTMKSLSTSDMVIMEDAVLGIPATRYADNATYSLLNIAGIGDLASENIIEGKTIAGIPGAHKCATTEVVAGVLVDDGGTMKVQKLTFDGTTPSDDGDPVTVESFYTFQTGRDEPVYDSGSSGGSTMEIYKCVDAEGMTWWVVSGCGSTEAKGRYYRGDDIASEYGGSYAAYYQQNGACSITYDSYNGYWALKVGSTNLYKDESYNYYDGDPSQCTSWVTDSGVEPVPTITTETTTGNGWKGKKYDTETVEISDTVTELEYKYNPPKFGKYYTSDGVIECDVFNGSGLIVYMPMRQLEAVTPQFFSNPYNGVTFTTIQSIYCGYFSGVGAIEAQENRLPTNGESRTVSLLLYRMTNENTIFFAYGKTTSSLKIFNFACQDNYVRISLWGPDYDFKDIVIDTNIWIHFTVVYTREYCKIYRNGVLAGTLDVTGDDNITDKIFQIGGLNYTDKSPDQSSAEVAISELKLYSRELSAEEIKAEADRCLAMVTE